LLARCSYMTVVPIRAVLAMCTALVLYGSPANLAWGNEENIDRPGSDFSNFDVVAPGGFIGPVDSCQISCERDGRCKAWTFVRAGIQGPKPRCWLKDAIPAPRANNCCTSGVPMRTLETNVDRPGRDYKNFNLPAADTNLCKTACEQEGSTCKAWTFVRAGVQGPTARCWLKNAVPPAFTNNCCASGVPGPILH
jgi:hypothetical protein